LPQTLGVRLKRIPQSAHFPWTASCFSVFRSTG